MFLAAPGGWAADRGEHAVHGGMLGRCRGEVKRSREGFGRCAQHCRPRGCRHETRRGSPQTSRSPAAGWCQPSRRMPISRIRGRQTALLGLDQRAALGDGERQHLGPQGAHLRRRIRASPWRPRTPRLTASSVTGGRGGTRQRHALPAIGHAIGARRVRPSSPRRAAPWRGPRRRSPARGRGRSCQVGGGVGDVGDGAIDASPLTRSVSTAGMPR